MRKGFQWYDLVFVVLFLYLFVLQIMAIWPFTIDDMYISLRYARNWANGDGLLWNIHEPPVEGYSNFSFVVLGALSLTFNANPVICLKIAGVIGLFFSCLFIYLISRFWFDKRQSFIPCIGLLLYKGQIIWAVSGLETTVYQSLIAGSVFFIFKGLGYQLAPNTRGEPKPISLFIAGLFLCLAGITRLEAPVLMAVFFFLICFDKPKTNISQFWKGVASFVIIILILFMPYFLWRWWYYGFIVPNPVYCKGFTASSYFALDFAYLKLVIPFLILALPACIKSNDRRHYFLWIPSIAYLLMLMSSDPVVGFYNRFFLPAFILLLPLSLQGIDRLVVFYTKVKDSVYYLAFYSAAFIVALFLIPKMSLADYRFFTKNPVAGEQIRGEVIQWLNSNIKGESVVLADSGMIPYYSNLNFIDSYCLNNRIMAHYPKDKMYDLFCKKTIGDKPKIIILTSLIEEGRIIYTPSDACFKAVIDKEKGYKLNKVFLVNKSKSVYRYELFTNF